MTPRHPPRALRSLTTPIGPPHSLGTSTRPQGRAHGTTRNGPGVSRRKEPARVPPSRSVRVRSKTRPRRSHIGLAVKLFVWRVPLTLAQPPASGRWRSATRVCVNPASRPPETWSDKVETLAHDTVNSCVTNHRIVREHGTDAATRPPWSSLLARGRSRPKTDGTAPRPESRVTRLIAQASLLTPPFAEGERPRPLRKRALGTECRNQESKNPQGEPA
jgi:hypothetical protein